MVCDLQFCAYTGAMVGFSFFFFLLQFMTLSQHTLYTSTHIYTHTLAHTHVHTGTHVMYTCPVDTRAHTSHTERHSVHTQTHRHTLSKQRICHQTFLTPASWFYGQIITFCKAESPPLEAPTIQSIIGAVTELQPTPLFKCTDSGQNHPKNV